MHRFVASYLSVYACVLERYGLRIRRSQVRVLPSALPKVLQNAGKEKSPGFAPGLFDTTLTPPGYPSAASIAPAGRTEES
jgi:hypothetical protein